MLATQNVELGAFLDRGGKTLEVLCVSADKLADLLITLDTHGLENDNNGNGLGQSILVKEEFAVLEGDGCARLLCQAATGDLGAQVTLRVFLDNDAIFADLLLDEDNFFGTFYDKVAAWVVRTLLNFSQLIVCFSRKHAIARAQHDRHHTNGYILLDVYFAWPRQ